MQIPYTKPSQGYNNQAGSGVKGCLINALDWWIMVLAGCCKSVFLCYPLHHLKPDWSSLKYSVICAFGHFMTPFELQRYDAAEVYSYCALECEQVVCVWIMKCYRIYAIENTFNDFFCINRNLWLKNVFFLFSRRVPQQPMCPLTTVNTAEMPLSKTQKACLGIYCKWA